LPLKLNTRTRRAATALINENVTLRLENDRLRNENALQTVHLAALKARKTPFTETTDKLESLRQKQREIQSAEQSFKMECEKRLEDLRLREQELSRWETDLKTREAVLPAEPDRVTVGSSLPSSPLSRDTSFRSGAAILDQRPSVSPLKQPTQCRPGSTTSLPKSDVVPKHLATKSETKAERNGRK